MQPIHPPPPLLPFLSQVLLIPLAIIIMIYRCSGSVPRVSSSPTIELPPRALVPPCNAHSPSTPKPPPDSSRAAAESCSSGRLASIPQQPPGDCPSDVPLAPNESGAHLQQAAGGSSRIAVPSDTKGVGNGMGNSILRVKAAAPVSTLQSVVKSAAFQHPFKVMLWSK